MSRLGSVRPENRTGFHVLAPPSRRTDRRKTRGARQAARSNADGDADEKENQTNLRPQASARWKAQAALACSFYRAKKKRNETRNLILAR
jgi:hypothetical protein